MPNAMPEHAKAVKICAACRQGHGAHPLPSFLPFHPSPPLLARFATPNPKPTTTSPKLYFPPLMTSLSLSRSSATDNRMNPGNPSLFSSSYVHVFKGRFGQVRSGDEAVALVVEYCMWAILVLSWSWSWLQVLLGLVCRLSVCLSVCLSVFFVSLSF